MKIGIDVTGCVGWRGPSRNARNIIKYLSLVGCEHTFYLYSAIPFRTVLPALGQNVKWIYLPVHKYAPWLNVTLPLAARKAGIDIFLFLNGNFWIWKPIKTIVLIRAYAIVPWENTIKDKLSAFFRNIRIEAVADKIGAVSRFNAFLLRIINNIPPQKIDIIPNGIDPIFYDDTITPYESYYNYILYVGGNTPGKNLEGVLQAFRYLKIRGCRENLVVVGGKMAPIDPEIEHFRLIAKELNIAEATFFHGIEKNDNRLASIYRGARCVVFPSFAETFGMVSVEAMACGCPVVASNAPAIPEICGDAAVYFDPYDPVDMADKIESVLKDDRLRADLIRKGQARGKRYSWEASARQLLDIMERIVMGENMAKA